MESIPEPVFWRAHAACASRGHNSFFPVRGTRTASRQTRDALAVCSMCEVRALCLEFALSTAQEDGIWGGCTEEQRRRIRRERRALRRDRDQAAIS